MGPIGFSLLKNSHLQQLPNRLPQKISTTSPALPHLLPHYATYSLFLFDKPTGLLHEHTAIGLLVKPACASSSSLVVGLLDEHVPLSASPTSSMIMPSLVAPTPPRACSTPAPRAFHASDGATSLENTGRRENIEGRGCCSAPHILHGALREPLKLK
jgi:hypothetical protein